MAQDENDAALVRATIDLAHNLGCNVVAEGIEDKRALGILTTLGCDFAQGCHIGRPKEGLEARLQTSRWKTKP